MNKERFLKIRSEIDRLTLINDNLDLDDINEINLMESNIRKIKSYIKELKSMDGANKSYEKLRLVK